MNINSSNNIPFGQLGLIVMENSTELGNKINDSLLENRLTSPNNFSSCEQLSEEDSSFLIPIKEIRFSNGEGKIVLGDSVRGKDIYILCDVGNYSCTYEMFGFTNHKGPDEHFQDIKRVVSAIAGKARRITVIMPLLYASRQDKRKGRESLDCATALQELARLGVNDIISFDVHNPSVQNAVPMVSFDNLYATYEIIKAFIKAESDLSLAKDKLLVISPDTGGMDRAIYYANVLGVDIGLFYKRRDHSTVVGGKNPIIEHKYIGRDIEGQNILIVDDMIASGESIFDLVTELKKRKANRIYVSVSFALFTEGIEKFKKFYDEGLIYKVYSTNLTYVPKEVKNSDWYEEVDMSELIANVINNLNYDKSISPIIHSTENIEELLNARRC